ncbi:DUF1573 domain-containing protein [Bacteroidota bacterium]
MKKYTTIIILLLFGFCLQAQENPITNNTSKDLDIPGEAKVNWENTVVDMGEIAYKKPQTAKFIFKNTGEKPVIVTNAKGSCGCTGIKYPKEPIKPGESGTIQATYNAASLGAFNKSVTVDINIPDGRQILRLKGTVVN